MTNVDGDVAAFPRRASRKMSEARAPRFWRVLERWREKHGRLPRRRRDLASSDLREEEALAKRVTRWLQTGTLPPALAAQLKGWVASERCGSLLGQVNAFRTSCGRMPHVQLSVTEISSEEDDLARRVSQYCNGGDEGTRDSQGDEQCFALTDDQLSDYGRLSSLIKDSHCDRVCPHVRHMFAIISTRMQHVVSAEDWNFVLMICVAAGHRTLSDLGSADLHPLTRLHTLHPEVRRAIPQVAAFARCFRTLATGYRLGLRSIRAFLTADQKAITSLVQHSGMNRESVGWALSEIRGVASWHARARPDPRPPPPAKRQCVRGRATRTAAPRSAFAGGVPMSGAMADRVPSAVLPRLCAELERCHARQTSRVAQPPRNE